MNSLHAGLTVRAFLIAVILTIVFGIWVRQAEIVVLSAQITESVPAIPAVAALLLLVALNPLLRTIRERLALTRAEILTIYIFIAIAISMAGVGVVRFWLALITAPFYFASPSNRLESLYEWIPAWLTVKDTELIHHLYEKSPTGKVPWEAWLVPIVVWTAFFLALWFCMLCMMLLVRRRWVDAERLTFPILELPLEITATAGQKDQPRFLRDPWMWAGFSLAAVYNLINILHALFPPLPTPGKYLDLNPLLSNPPWDSLRPLTLHYRPDLVGFGFLVPSEICFSIWFFYLVARLEGFFLTRYAHDVPGIPFEQEQSIGAFLLLGVWFLWEARQDIARSFRRGRTHPNQADGTEAPRWAVPGLIGSFLFLCWFCQKAGMADWVAFAYLVIILLTAVVCARIRAEAGVPIIWLFPYYQQKKILLYTLGTTPFLASGTSTLVIFAMLTFLSRGYFPGLIGYQIDGLKIADEARMSRSRMCATIMLATLVGLLVAYYFHLTPYYHYGGQNLREGVWGSEMALQEYSDVVAAQQTPQPPDRFRTGASIVGAGVAGILLFCRRNFVGFPLHPIGYAVATAYGSLVWWSFFLVWILKWMILKAGGLRLYRRAVPAFLGFTLGHFFVAGAVWGLLGALWPDAGRVYAVWFG